MSMEILTPSIELLSQEYVLVQAWKKTSAYIRYHNWYADTLELDRSSVNLPQFLSGLSTEIRQSVRWQNTPLRMVPAPKSQDWHVSKAGMWEPRKRGEVESKLRPLAHADLRSQVVATAIMMCLADRVETAQGDPRSSHQEGFGERRVISYGNRLFCDATPAGLRHRWGSSKLYRAYYQDYRSFIARPEVAVQAITDSENSRVVVVHSDLKQFYDRVRPGLLTEKLAAVLQPGDDPAFHEFASHMLRWRWDERDAIEVSSYERIACIEDFSSIALPQGLVSAGFFANLVLLDFDEALRNSLLMEVYPGIRVVDAARYVDDLRIVLTVDSIVALDKVKEVMCEWLQAKLDETARGLKVSDEKTHAAELRGERRPLVRQSRKMARIQGAISGGFDAAGGVEILDAVQGLIRSQQRYSEARSEDSAWEFAPVPDVRDATVARFAAARYRTTYRSLRPMLAERGDISLVDGELEPGQDLERVSDARTQEDLDEDAKAFALGLIEGWIDDPANVRLLRIGLDLWPAPEMLLGILELLRPFTIKGGKRKAPRRVAWYCLAEIFRAGATETGFVEDAECLPARVDLTGYRQELGKEAFRLSAQGVGLPWYLRQQILLFLAVHDPTLAPIARAGTNSETKHYRELIRYLRGDSTGVAGADFATLAVLARRSFSDQARARQLALQDIGPRRLEQIVERDPNFSLELIRAKPELAETVTPRLRDDLCLQLRKSVDGLPSLAELVLGQQKNGVLRNELALLSFSIEFLKNLKERLEVDVITPMDVRVELQDDRASWPVRMVTIVDSRISSGRSLYAPPAWCPPEQRWRFHLGYLLRFVLTAREDFTRSVQEAHWKEDAPTYRPGVNHWYQRLHGLFHGHAAFGDDWMPISEWVEQLLSALLRWPGTQAVDAFGFVESGPEALMMHLRERITLVRDLHGPTTGLLMLPLAAPWPIRHGARPLRACVVQTIIPGGEDFNRDDLTCSDPKMRKRHRRHLSSALAAIERMLDLRETHKGRDGRLDWLILPELSVHPDDVRTHLIPFARAHKTIILAGLTYEELFRGQPFVNSGLWIIPAWDSAHGLQMRVRRQGKHHLAPMEDSLNSEGTLIRGFRPCQWLVGYEWGSAGASREPLWLTAAICYDATDLALASDLRNRSDVFAIPALNRDVGTFDQMSLALHYHMFQMVIVANNGLYGGSNAYAPYKEPYSRQVFHLHGQPQASIAFLEIEPIDLFQQRKAKVSIVPKGDSSQPKAPQWKAPPAGLGE